MNLLLIGNVLGIDAGFSHLLLSIFYLLLSTFYELPTTIYQLPSSSLDKGHWHKGFCGIYETKKWVPDNVDGGVSASLVLNQLFNHVRGWFFELAPLHHSGLSIGVPNGETLTQ